jgi:RNA polymerase sigma factor (sigma-70 family)
MGGNNRTVRAGPSVDDLVTRARKGDKQAWDVLVERYAPLIWSTCRQYRLDDADAGDVGQMVWLHLVDQLGDLRDPAALPGWLATTTRRQCIRVRRAAARLPQATRPLMDADNIADMEAVPVEHKLLLAKRHAALHEAFTRLPPCWQQLIAVLIEDPPMPYAQISAQLGIAVGSIGPTRRRCLDALRRDPAIAALIDAEDASAGGELSRHTTVP